MKKILFIALAVMCSTSLWAQAPSASSSTSASPSDGNQESREMKHEEREKAREQKAAAYVKFIDSLVVSHNFTFLPSDFTMEPAGRMRQISNPNFRVGIYPDYVDIMLPYYRGVTPPYVITVMNYTVPNPDKYAFIQTKHGWQVYFESGLYSANKYKFTFNIYSTTGETTLEIVSDFLNTVTYSGSIIGNN